MQKIVEGGLDVGRRALWMGDEMNMVTTVIEPPTSAIRG